MDFWNLKKKLKMKDGGVKIIWKTILKSHLQDWCLGRLFSKSKDDGMGWDLDHRWPLHEKGCLNDHQPGQ